MKTDINEIKAGKYEVVSRYWDEILSKPGEPFNFRRHRRGDTVQLTVEDARRLVLGGAVKKKGDEDPATTIDGPSVAPGEDPPAPDGGSSSDSKKPVAEDPAAHNIPDVKDYVGDDAEKAKAVLELEQKADKPRSTLIEWLEGIATAPPAPPAGGSGDGSDASGSGSGQS